MSNRNHLAPEDAAARLKELAARWANTDASERASFQSWLIDFCKALGVDAPVPPTPDYCFELPIPVVDRQGRETTNFIDCWKAGYFAIEAKASGTDALNDSLLRKAFGQLVNYLPHVSGDIPPYLMVVDVPRTLIVWDRWSGRFGGFAAGRRIALATLHQRPEDIALLFDIFEQPAVRDPRGRAQAVTREIAAGLGELAAELEGRGLDTERVARFLMRCVFSCFAEDVGLLPDQLFRRTLETARASGDTERLGLALTSLWKTMDSGGMFGAEMLHRFNGHFFKTVEALPLAPNDVSLLIEAAKHDWARVEPSIFGTLLVRALDPDERHRLGAEYTPRAYIERLVEPTVVEPIRERWTAVQAAVIQLKETRKKKDVTAAVKQLREFHEWMRGLSFLDPACGSGNFLYVTMIAVKRIEAEVLAEIQTLSGGQGGLVLDEVHPRQFHGIEIKPWAREIAELTLWIGYHQFWREAHGGRTPPDPILEDTGTIECRDAVLAWDEIVHRPERDRPDPTPRVRHPVTGELVPDPEARLPYYEYVGARQAEWPRADFIVGNPPYIGGTAMRESLGDGYVEALRRVYPQIRTGADLVVFWIDHAVGELANGNTVRAGLITTNSIVQQRNRDALERARAVRVGVVWAVRDHPWAAEQDSAAIRVALIVLSHNPAASTLIEVDERGQVLRATQSHFLASDLTTNSGLVGAVTTPLFANAGLSSNGFYLRGAGFVLSRARRDELIARDGRNAAAIRRYWVGRDLASRPTESYVIDFADMSFEDASQYPLLLDHLRDHVLPERLGKKEKAARERWWQFWRARMDIREAVRGCPRVIFTPYVTRHRFFAFANRDDAPDDTIIVCALWDAFHLGILSSRLHVTWSDSAGGRLGIGNDNRYNSSLTLAPFPFPSPNAPLRTRIADVAERLDAHRKAAIARDERVTMTGMYNVVEKLRSGEALTPKERAIHEIAACGVLRDLHDELDVLVAEAYGWPWPMAKEEILERLVSLHDERVAEERKGIVRWLRPDYQIPRFGADLPAPPAELALVAGTAATPAAPVERRPWPASAVAQLEALGVLVAQRGVSVEEAAAAFTGARRDLVLRHLETLELMGEVTRDGDGRFHAARKAA